MGDETMPKQKLIVAVETEVGCDYDDMEYCFYIYKVIDSLLTQRDFELAEECIFNHVRAKDLPEEGLTYFELTEAGEWEDVHWFKYFEITKRLGDTDTETDKNRIRENLEEG
jgi:hypothetical protein